MQVGENRKRTKINGSNNTNGHFTRVSAGISHVSCSVRIGVKNVSDEDAEKNAETDLMCRHF